MRKHDKVRGQPEENSFRETLRFFMLYRYDDFESYEDHVLRQRYLWFWEKGLMQMELTKEQVEAMVKKVQEIMDEEVEGDECNDCVTKEMDEELKEINKPSKEKLSYIG